MRVVVRLQRLVVPADEDEPAGGREDAAVADVTGPGTSAVHARRFVRMFMATTLPCECCAGLPFWAERPSIWKKFPSGFSWLDSLYGSAFQAAELSFEQTYMYPVRGL